LWVIESDKQGLRTIGAIGYSALGASPQEGFRIGAAVGFIAGGVAGWNPDAYVSVAKTDGFTGKNVFNGIMGQAKSTASGVKGGAQLVEAGAAYANIGAWPIWQTAAGYVNLALPYIVAVGEAGALVYLDNCIGNGTCGDKLPKDISTSKSWSF
jgi:hypothetical protein